MAKKVKWNITIPTENETNPSGLKKKTSTLKTEKV